MGITKYSMRTKSQRIARGKTRRLAKAQRAKAFGTHVSVKPPVMSKTKRTKLIYSHPSGPAMLKVLRTWKPKTTHTRRGTTVAVMNVNRATGTRRSGRLAGNTALVSLNNLPKKTRARPAITKANMNAFLAEFEGLTVSKQ